MIEILIENSKSNSTLKDYLIKYRTCDKKPLNVQFFILNKFEVPFYSNTLHVKHLKDYYYFSKSNESMIECGILSEKTLLKIPFKLKQLQKRKQ